MNSLIPFFIVLAGGAVLPLQSLINARLGTVLGGITWAAGYSAFCSGVLLLLISPFLGGRGIPFATLHTAPPWVWAGGLFGALYMFTSVYGISKLGAAGLVCTVVLGQMLAALLLDTYGVLHAAVPLTPQRVAGCVIVVFGVWLANHRF